MANSTSNEHVNNEKNHPNNIDTTSIINCSLLALLIPIAIIGNSLVLGAILRSPTLRSTSAIIFICSLAVSDLLVGFIVQPLYVASLLTTVDFVKIFAEASAYTTCGASLCTITAISVDRFMALINHMRYSTLVTSSRAMYTAVTIYFINFFVTSVYFYNRTTYLLIMTICICLSLLISSFSYIAIYRIVHRHKVQIHAQQQAMQNSNQASNNVNMTQLKRSALNTFVFYIVTILCYLPVAISLSIYNLSFENWTRAWNFADTLVFMNSSVNPFLFCWRLRELRTAVVKIGRQMLCRKTERL